jgi:DNA repair protein SbcC/Rad50
MASGLKVEHDQLVSSFEKTIKGLELLDRELNTLSGSQTTLKLSLENAQKELDRVQTEIDQRLLAEGFESETIVNEILRTTVDIPGERKALDAFRLSLHNTQRDLDMLKEQGTAETYDVQKHQEVTEAGMNLTQELNVQRNHEGGMDQLLSKLRQDLVQRDQLIAERNRLQLRKAHLDDLARLFRSSGFVDYASSIYLRNLIQAANHRFHQMTRQRLHLELGEGNSFWVRDLLNGGHMRLLKTLSGGQKFQAALSLALALADHIHHRNQSIHNFFFLDEGFGSLDKNALQVVFETLKSLRKENRIVGIISHVEELQQEIQTYLRIEEGEEGSQIFASWQS